ncbi:MAG: hypothetical protein ACLRWP_20195 [Bilophila wadsworthia]
MNTSTPHAFALFSGGLDSILAARLIMEQGLVVRCLHFVTPFFGKPQLIPTGRRCSLGGKPWTSVKRSCAS